MLRHRVGNSVGAVGNRVPRHCAGTCTSYNNGDVSNCFGTSTSCQSLPVLVCRAMRMPIARCWRPDLGTPGWIPKRTAFRKPWNVVKQPVTELAAGRRTNFNAHVVDRSSKSSGRWEMTLFLCRDGTHSEKVESPSHNAGRMFYLIATFLFSTSDLCGLAIKSVLLLGNCCNFCRGAMLRGCTLTKQEVENCHGYLA